ncbi:MAG: Ig-like domain-containing protein [Candidatus Korobacteraceae bacterium]
MQKWLLSLLLVGVTLFVGCGGSSSSGGNTPPPTTPTLTAITVTPANPAIALGTTQPTQQFAATGTYSDGSTKVLTSTANWISSNPAVATVNTTGLATGMTAGTTTISATSGTITGSTVLTVNPAPLVSIAVTPATATVAPSGTQQYTAMGTYADGSTQNITLSVTWSASAGTISQSGLANTTGVTPGSTVTIMAAQGNISGTATLTITNPLVSIAVTPLTASIAQQTTQQYVAIGTYADHSTQVITTSVTWNSSNTTVATISNSQGTQGLATSGTTAGMTTITATSGLITSLPATLTVTSATLVSIAVTPMTPQIVYQTQQAFVATGTYSDSSTQVITGSVTWASSDTTKITITVSGVATGVNTTTSPVTISATKGTVVGSTTATVVPAPVVSIAITPVAPTTLAMGTSRQYTATATLGNGSTLNVTNVATWTSLNTAVATVGVHNGVVQAATTVPTTTTVTFNVTYNSVTQSFNVDVTSATATSITVTPITPSIPVGVNQRFDAVATFSDGSTQDITQVAAWSSNNTPVATISPTLGLAFGVSPGSATITALFETISGTATLTVDSGTLQSIAVTPSQTILAPASTVTYQAVGTYSDGTTQFISGLVTWASSAPSVVSIATTGGTATAQSPGTANITATYQGVTSPNATVLVTGSALSTIVVTPSPGQAPEGVALQFAATGHFADTSTQNLTTNVTWASSQPSIATVSNATGQQGLAEGVTAGQTTITAVFAGIVGNAFLNVTNATLMSIAITPANSHAPVGSSVLFDAKGTFSDQSVVDLSTQVAWSSSVPAVATINSVGVANTASSGTTVITASFTQQTQTGPVTVTATTNLTVP